MVVWLPSRIIDWTFVVPPAVVPSTSAAGVYYALSHSPFTRPIPFARFLLVQRCELSLDLSETGDALPNTKFEAHLLWKSSELPHVKLVLKSHAGLHQQQLVEVPLLEIAGLWILSI